MRARASQGIPTRLLYSHASRQYTYLYICAGIRGCLPWLCFSRCFCMRPVRDPDNNRQLNESVKFRRKNLLGFFLLAAMPLTDSCGDTRVSCSRVQDDQTRIALRKEASRLGTESSPSVWFLTIHPQSAPTYTGTCASCLWVIMYRPHTRIRTRKWERQCVS